MVAFVQKNVENKQKYNEINNIHIRNGDLRSDT